MSRTTLKIESAVLRELKQRAARQGRTLQDVTNDLLRQALRPPRRAPYKFALQPWKAELQPGADLLDRDKLFDLMDGR